MYLRRKYQLWTLLLRPLLETGRHFTWSSEPREGSAAWSAKRVPSFLSYFKTLINGRAPGIEPATSCSADWANPACSVWDWKQCKISNYVHRNTPLLHWWVSATWCSKIKHYTVVLSHPFRPRSYYEKLSRKGGSPSSWVNGKNSWLLCPLSEPTVLAHALIVSPWLSWPSWASQSVCIEKRWLS